MVLLVFKFYLYFIFIFVFANSYDKNMEKIIIMSKYLVNFSAKERHYAFEFGKICYL